MNDAHNSMSRVSQKVDISPPFVSLLSEVFKAQGLIWFDFKVKITGVESADHAVRKNH
jgi:hypothetical protein